MKLNKNNIFYWGSFFAYLLASSILWINIPAFTSRIENDSHAYFSLLKTFQKTGYFYANKMIVSTWFGIGYPLFMAACKRLYNNDYTIIFIQILLMLLILHYTYKTAHSISPSIAPIAIALAATNLGYILYPHFFLTETLLLFCIQIGFYWLIKQTQETHALGYLSASGLIFGLSILIKPSMLFLVPLISIRLISKEIRLTLKKIILFIGPFLIFPLGLMTYYQKTTGYWYLKSVDKINLYYFFLPHLQGVIKKSPWTHEQEMLNKKYPIQNYAHPYAFEPINALFTATVLQYPTTACKVWLTQMIKTMLGLYTNHLKILLSTSIKGGECSFFEFKGTLFQKAYAYITYKTDSWILIILALWEFFSRLCFIFCALYGTTLIINKKQWDLFWLLIIPCGYFWGITGADGCGRLRLLVEPFFIILSSIGIENIQNYYKRP